MDQAITEDFALPLLPRTRLHSTTGTHVQIDINTTDIAPRFRQCRFGVRTNYSIPVAG
jgi:hypothetical protein